MATKDTNATTSPCGVGQRTRITSHPSNSSLSDAPLLRFNCRAHSSAVFPYASAAVELSGNLEEPEVRCDEVGVVAASDFFLGREPRNSGMEQRERRGTPGDSQPAAFALPYKSTLRVPSGSILWEAAIPRRGISARFGESRARNSLGRKRLKCDARAKHTS